MAQRLYLLVRTDVSVAVQAVQMAHIAAVMGMAMPKVDWSRITFKCLAVPDEAELFRRIRWAASRTDSWQIFKEPDLKNRVVAGAVLHDGDLFDDIPLWNP